MVVYAFDVDETLKVSNGPVRLVDLVKLRQYVPGHDYVMVGNILGDFSYLTALVPVFGSARAQNLPALVDQDRGDPPCLRVGRPAGAGEDGL